MSLISYRMHCRPQSDAASLHQHCSSSAMGFGMLHNSWAFVCTCQPQQYANDNNCMLGYCQTWLQWGSYTGRTVLI